MNASPIVRPRSDSNVVRAVAFGGIMVETNMTYTPAPAVSWAYKPGWHTRRASSLRRG